LVYFIFKKNTFSFIYDEWYCHRKFAYARLSKKVYINKNPSLQCKLGGGINDFLSVRKGGRKIKNKTNGI